MKKGIYNIMFGFLGQIITIGLGLIIPRLVLINLGSEANGLLNSVNSFIAYLALLEAGIGTTTLQALYGPVGRSDHKSINEVMNASSYFYKKTGAIYLASVIVLSLVYALFVKSEIPQIHVFLVILFSGLSGVFNYFFRTKFEILLTAEGKNYVIVNLSTITTVLVSITKIVLLLLGFGVVAVQGMYFAYNLLQILFINYYIRRNYKWLDSRVIPDFNAISQKYSVLVHQISTLIFNNTDIFFLTLFVDLKAVSIYTMYNMLYGMIKTAIETINSGVTFAIGQKFHTDRKKFIQMQDAFEVYNMALTFSLYCIANIFILPFLELYTAGVTDIQYVDKKIPILFGIVFLLGNGRKSSNQVITYAGHFKQTQSRSVVESIINLIVSFLAVNKFGIYGVLIGTIVALLYRTSDMIIYASKKILNRSPFITYKRWFLNLALYVFFSYLASNIEVKALNYGYIILEAAVACIIIVPCFIFVNSFVERGSFKFVCGFLKSKLKRTGEI